MATDLLTLAKNVKRGVRLLDRKFPTWRRTLRAHAREFNLADGEHCVLGTLEHHLGRAREFRKRKKRIETGYFGLKIALGIEGTDYGFYWGTDEPNDIERAERIRTISTLWRAEFEQ